MRCCHAIALSLLVLSGQGVALGQKPSAQRPADATPRLPPVVPAAGPGMLIVSCDSAGCWDEFGVRYDRADAGVFIRKDGRSCLAVKSRMHCE